MAKVIHLDEEEAEELVKFLNTKPCNEWRQGSPCVDRQGKGNLVDGKHPGCAWAEHLINKINDAE